MSRRMILAVAGSMMIAATAHAQQPEVYKARLEPEAKNVGLCMEIDSALRREHTLTVTGATAKVASSGGVKANMKQTAAKTYENALVQMGPNQFKIVADLNKKPATMVITDNRMGCRWSGVLSK